MNIEERFWSKVDASGDCWLWTGSGEHERYGQFRVNERLILAHRFAYELLCGPIPDGLVIDHLCRTTHCVNPDHLEPVTIRENTLRGVGRTARQVRQTHCVHGHEFTPETTRIMRFAGRLHRSCRLCLRAGQSRRRRAARLTARDAS